MSYIINKTNGDVLTEIVDGTVDQISTDLTLFGKNSSNYGELFNENFVKLLENFANTSTPNHPQQGQLWYDTGDGRLKVYDGAGWKVSGGTIVANAVPSSFTRGDIWIDSLRQQLYYNDGSASLLAGPIYTAQQGVSGFQVNTVVDTDNLSHPVVFLYVGQVLLGLFSKVEFTPLVPIPGYTGTVKIGFNTSSYAGVKFNVPASQADSLVSPSGEFKTTSSFLSSTDITTTAVGSLIIQNSTPLILGQSSSTEFNVSTDKFTIESKASGQNFEIKSLILQENLTSFYINATTKRVGIYTNSPGSSIPNIDSNWKGLDVNGNAVIRGDLLVQGLTSTINATNLIIEDKQIELGKGTSNLNITGTVATTSATTTITGVSSVVGLIPGMALTQVLGTGNFGSNPVITSIDSASQITITSGSANTTGAITFSAGGVTDVTADGGGIFLHGSTNKTIMWQNSNDAWKSSENFDIATGKTFMINGFTVISNDSLGSGIISAPSLSSVGDLTNLTVANLKIDGNTIGFKTGTPADSTLILIPKGLGTVDVSSKRITSLATPSDNTDATTKLYVDTAVSTKDLALSADTTGLANQTTAIATEIINKVFPVADYPNGTKCRIHCVNGGIRTNRLYAVATGAWDYQGTL